MKLHNVGYNHVHDADFFIDRPDGSGDWLLLILKSESIFTLNGKDVYVPENAFLLYPEGVPQYYRCMPQNIFANDWVHFEFEQREGDRLAALDIPLAQPVQLAHTAFFSYCIKLISDENASDNRNRDDNIQHYMWLMLNRISDLVHTQPEKKPEPIQEMLLTMRNKIYAEPYIPRGISWAAHEVRMSRTGFQNYYKKCFGVTFMQDLINARMEYAKTLLMTTNMTVREIAVQCGYRNYEHFERQFRDRCEMSPMEYRTNNFE